MDVPLSIVIPTHNRREMLQDVLAAFEKQTYEGPWEYVVVLDGCADGTAEMLSSLVLRHPLRTVELPGLGAAIARNRGAFEAEGEYVLFIDDDVIPSPRMVEEHVSWHDLHANTAVVGACPFGAGIRLSRLGQYGRDWWHAQYRLMAESGHESTFRDFLTGNVSLPRRAFTDLGGFDESFRNAGREDYEFGLRLLESGVEVRFNPEAYGCHFPADGFDRILRRYRVQGKADVVLTRLHPSLISTTDLASLSRNRCSMRAVAKWAAFHTPWLAGGLGALGARWLSLTHRLLPPHRRLRVAGSLFVLNYWLGAREQGFRPAELDHLAEDWVRDPAERRLRFHAVDLTDDLREIGDIENLGAVLIRVTNGGRFVGWVCVPPRDGKTCITVEELSSAVSDGLRWQMLRQAGKEDMVHAWKYSDAPVTWESLAEALKVEGAKTGHTAREGDSSPAPPEVPAPVGEVTAELEDLWYREVEQVFSDPEVSAVVGPVLPRVVDSRADELLWEMETVEGRLFGLPFSVGEGMSSARAALEIDPVSHWIVVRPGLMSRLGIADGEGCPSRILSVLLHAGHTVVYHPGAVMWSRASQGRDEFRRRLRESRRELGRLSAEMLIRGGCSRLDVLRAVSRWTRWRIKRGLKWFGETSGYPISASLAELFHFTLGALQETGATAFGRRR